VAGSYGHDNEPSGSINGEEFLEPNEHEPIDKFTLCCILAVYAQLQLIFTAILLYTTTCIDLTGHHQLGLRNLLLCYYVALFFIFVNS
jgi:hypothetical protein